jgi:uncharacterized membrane protein
VNNTSIAQPPSPATQSAQHLWHRARYDWVALALACALGSLLAWLSVRRYTGYNAGMLDLGNMAQAIWSAGQGQPLIYTAPDGPLSRLGWHVELIYLLIAPWYALLPDPRLLLVLQATLFALGALPVYRMALRRTASRFAARCLAAGYLLYPTALTSVLFDLHGDTLAMPLLLFLLDALDRRAWWASAVWAALALSCKFYVALPVALLGLVWWRYRGERRVGLALWAAGTLYGAVAFFVVRPLFGGASAAAQPNGASYLSFYFGAWAELLASLDQRVLSALVVFGPLLLLAWRGWPWLLPALPLALAALLSTGPGGAYDYRYHHYAVAVPFIVAAAIEGLGRLKDRAEQGQRLRRPWRGEAGLALAIVALFAALLVDTPLNPLFWLNLPGRGLDPSAYGLTRRDALKTAWLRDNVPPQTPLAASNFLAPHLSNRATLHLLRYPDEPTPARFGQHLNAVDYAVADALFDYATPIDGGFAGGITYDADAIALLLRAPNWGLVAARDGLLLFQKNPAAERVLPQYVEVDAAQPAPPRAQFADAIALRDWELTPLGDGRYRLRYEWQALRPLNGPPLVAVSRLVGVADARLPHLPTLALHPTPRWTPGQVVRETFELRLPPDLAAGSYELRVGWYDSGHFAAAATDARSRVGEEFVLGNVNVTR